MIIKTNLTFRTTFNRKTLFHWKNPTDKIFISALYIRAITKPRLEKTPEISVFPKVRTVKTTWTISQRAKLNKFCRKLKRTKLASANRPINSSTCSKTVKSLKKNKALQANADHFSFIFINPVSTFKFYIQISLVVLKFIIYSSCLYPDYLHVSLYIFLYVFLRYGNVVRIRREINGKN